MNDCKLYQGRTAQLCNLISKPELNGLWVVVFKYQPDKNRYSVLRLICPTAVPKMDILFLDVKFLNLNFGGRRTFDLCFPGVVARDGSEFESDVATAETVWDLTYSPPREVTDTPLIIRSSCCVRGAPQEPCNIEATSRISCNVVVDCGSPKAFVEFQDIHFVMHSGTLIKCCAAKQIVFRRCVFHGQFAVCIAGTRDAPVDVLFEWCHFEGTTRNALNVGRNAQLTMLSCCLSNLKHALTMQSGASAVLIHCHMYDVHSAIGSLPKCKSLVLIHCSIGRAEWGVCLNQCDSLLMQGCSMFEAQSLFLDDVRTANIQDSVFQGAELGVFVSCGDSTTTVSNCHFWDTKEHDILVGNLATGSLTIENCTFTPSLGINRLRQYVGCKCRVTVNGTEVHSYIDSTRPAGDLHHTKTGQQQLGVLSAVRFNKKIGIGKVLCFCCDKEEPPDVKFKNCAKCNAACYCSRECQVAHWKQHKADCKAVASAGFLLAR